MYIRINFMRLPYHYTNYISFSAYYTGSTITNCCFLFCSCIHIHRPRLLFRHLFFPVPMYNFGYLCKIIEFWLYIPIWGTFGSSTIFTNLAYFHVMNIFSWNYWPQNHQKSDNFQKVGQFWNSQSLIFLNSFEKFEFFLQF